MLNSLVQSTESPAQTGLACVFDIIHHHLVPGSRQAELLSVPLMSGLSSHQASAHAVLSAWNTRHPLPSFPLSQLLFSLMAQLSFSPEGLHGYPLRHPWSGLGAPITPSTCPGTAPTSSSQRTALTWLCPAGAGAVVFNFVCKTSYTAGAQIIFGQ